MGLEWTARRWCREQRGLFVLVRRTNNNNKSGLPVRLFVVFGAGDSKVIHSGALQLRKKMFLRMLSENFWREILFCSWDRRRCCNQDEQFQGRSNMELNGRMSILEVQGVPDKLGWNYLLIPLKII